MTLVQPIQPLQLAERMAHINQRPVSVTTMVTPKPESIVGEPPGFTYEVVITDNMVELAVILDDDGNIASFVPWQFDLGGDYDPRPLFGFLFWVLNGMEDVTTGPIEAPRKSKRVDSRGVVRVD